MLRLAIAIFAAAIIRSLAAEAPPIPREFRGVWVASVGNIDWPSRPGLPTETQQAELRFLLDGFRRLRLNVVIFQVRTSCDALYESQLEPWSEYLSGRMGVAPATLWDPLKFAIEEAHARGMELHAWFNPFRARYQQQISPVSPNHISKTHPEMVRTYGPFQWLDPGLPEAREYSISVIRDVVQRYDVDGIHIDDYFYPYPIFALGAVVPFPDDASYDRYRRGGGKAPRNEWRRENINNFIGGLGQAIHREKPWVKFGVSPFGIWRPGTPEPIKGLDAYELLSADSRKWLNEGLSDYFVPQLYWNIGAPNQGFKTLLNWWRGQNLENRILVAGVASDKIGKDRGALELLNQIRECRTGDATNGVAFWNASSLRDNRGGLAVQLQRESFAQPALVPAAPWLGSKQPATPTLNVLPPSPRQGLVVQWTGGDPAPYSYILQARFGSAWRWETVSSATNRYTFLPSAAGLPGDVRLIPLSRTGVEGTAAEWVRSPLPRQ